MDIKVTEKQAAFINSEVFETLFGGAAGGGKSYGQVVDAMLYAMKHPGSQQLILRRTFPELEKSLIRMSHELIPKTWAKYNASSHTYVFKNRSIVDFGFCDAESDVYKYQSAEYDVIRFDELTHFTETMYLYLLSRCRGANSYPKRIKSSTNPGQVGHAWVKQRFVDPSEPNVVFGEKGKTRVFIPSFAQDNNFLMEADPEYIGRLEMLPEKERKALLEGRWDIFEGQYFSMWEPKVHVVMPFEMPYWWRRYATMDYGMDMLAVLWIAVDDRGTSYVYRELYEPGLTVSRAIERVCQIQRERVDAFFAPPDLFNRHADTGKSTADYFLEKGIPLVRSRNNRIPGWYALAEALQPYMADGAKVSRMKIFACCRNLIRCLPSLQHDKHNPNDCAKEPHEITHSPDALRYYITERPIAAVREVYTEPTQEENFLNWRMAYG